MTTEILAAGTFDYFADADVYTDTFYLTYTDMEEALVDYLRKNKQLSLSEIVISSDIPVPLSYDETLETDGDEIIEPEFQFDLDIVKV